MKIVGSNLVLDMQQRQKKLRRIYCLFKSHKTRGISLRSYTRGGCLIYDNNKKLTL